MLKIKAGILTTNSGDRHILTHVLVDGLVGADDGHLGLDRMHVLAQGNPMLLRLVPIGVKAGSECMDLVSQGLGQTRGDLRVAVHWVARARCGYRDIIVGLVIGLVKAPELHLRHWNR